MSKTFTSLDSVEYLTGIEDVAAYLEAALDEAGDDSAVISQALGTIARSGNVSELARRVGMSREGLYKALSGDGNPSFATIRRSPRRSASSFTSSPSPEPLGPAGEPQAATAR